MAILICLYSSTSFADRDGWRGEGYEHQGRYRERYYPQPPMGYYPPPPPRYRGGSPQGLAGYGPHFFHCATAAVKAFFLRRRS